MAVIAVKLVAFNCTFPVRAGRNALNCPILSDRSMSEVAAVQLT